MSDSFEIHKKSQFLKHPARHWDLFYKRNSNNFFKDRHWTLREFPDLCPDKGHSILLEIGCGHGSFAFPLLESTNLFIYAVDFSPKAIDLVKSHPDYREDRIKAFVMDISKGSIPEIPLVDLVSCIFILSAVPPESLRDAVQNIYDLMAQNGILIFRDYAIGDLAQLRFKPGSEISSGCYYRSDGTLSFFFSIEFFRELFESVGFQILEAEYVHKDVVNRKQDLKMERIFLQARIRKNEL